MLSTESAKSLKKDRLKDSVPSRLIPSFADKVSDVAASDETRRIYDCETCITYTGRVAQKQSATKLLQYLHLKTFLFKAAYTSQ